jgi:hypothetical protein
VSQGERRQHRRVHLRLAISRLASRSPSGADSGLRTENVSAGGMYFQAPADLSPAEGTYVFFELSVPPGDGYSPSPGSIRGTGQVVRTDALKASATGVAVRFTQPLALDF